VEIPLFDAGTGYRHAFGTTVTLVILGCDFNAVIEEACRTV
jgi:hypothetical protein